MKKAEDVLSKQEIEHIVKERVEPFKITREELESRYDLRQMMLKFNEEFFGYDFIKNVEIKFDGRLTNVAGNCWRYHDGRKVIKLGKINQD